jgi:hypothetical protein
MGVSSNPNRGGRGKEYAHVERQTSPLRRNDAAASDPLHLGRSIRSFSTGLFAELIISRCAIVVCSRLIMLRELLALFLRLGLAGLGRYSPEILRGGG